HNFSMKAISILLALFIWAFTRASDPIEERGFQFDVVVRLDPGVAIAHKVPERSKEIVNVRGTASRLARLVGGNPKAVLDARGMEPGETRIIHPRLEPNIRGLQVEFEDTFEITVDTFARSTYVPDEVTDGNLPVGFYIDARIGLPSEVMVEGAKSLLEQVSRVVYFLDLSGIGGSTEVPVVFQAVDSNGSPIANLTLTPPGTTIGISLQPSQASKTVPVVVDYRGTPATNYALTSLSSEPFLVDVSGPAEALVDIVNVRTAPINLTGKTASFQQTVSLINPGGNVSLSVIQVTVRVSIEQISGRATFEGLLIQLRGVNDARYTYSLNPQRVDVTISGAVDVLAQVTEGLIHPQVYLDNLGPGTHTVRVSVNVPSGVALNSVSPSEIRVVIEERETLEDEPEENGEDEIEEPE
ncbi:MAG TPA: hypothetical protein ENN67_00785, partial [Firmicutes bacterium]|nr:hypothetical protein [Bacillota bacterium]